MDAECPKFTFCSDVLGHQIPFITGKGMEKSSSLENAGQDEMRIVNCGSRS